MSLCAWAVLRVVLFSFFLFFFFKQKTAYEMLRSLVGSEMCIRDRIVGSAEANPAEGRISNESPMGRALMGGRVGQHKQINTPGGTINVDIVEIE